MGDGYAVRCLNLSLPVCAPESFTLSSAWSHFRERARRSAPIDLPLLLPRDVIALGLPINAPFTARLRYVPNASGAPRALEIAWTPAASSAFPAFSGIVTTLAEGSDRCRLSIGGRYDAPGAVADVTSDAIVGGRMTRATLYALLKVLRTAAEADYGLRIAL